MNYLVCNTIPELPDGTWSWSNTGLYGDLAGEMVRQLGMNHLALTSGPINPYWAVDLLNEIESTNYHAVLGPPDPNQCPANKPMVQVYLLRGITD